METVGGWFGDDFMGVVTGLGSGSMFLGVVFWRKYYWVGVGEPLFGFMMGFKVIGRDGGG